MIDLHVVIASVEYRLASEHRLPTAYDDAVEVLHGIKTTHDKWLKEYADFSNCYDLFGWRGEGGRVKGSRVV